MRHSPLASFVIAFLLAALVARAQVGNSQEPRKPDLPEIQALWSPWQDALKAGAADRDKKLANLDYVYMLNLDKLMKERSAAVDLDGALAAKAELDRLGGRQATTEEQRNSMPPALRTLRGSYDTALKGYLDEASRRDDALAQKYLADLEALQKRITMSGDLQKAVVVKSERERALAEASKLRLAPAIPNGTVPPATGLPAGSGTGVNVGTGSSASKSTRDATLFITADNRYSVWLNGKLIGSGSNWERLDKYEAQLAPADALCILASDDNSGKESAGLYCGIVLKGSNLSVGTDGAWKCTTRAQKEDWFKKDAKLLGLTGMSTRNIPRQFRGKLLEFQSRDGAELKGGFVWSDEAKKTIYVQKVIDFREFR